MDGQEITCAFAQNVPFNLHMFWKRFILIYYTICLRQLLVAGGRNTKKHTFHLPSFIILLSACFEVIIDWHDHNAEDHEEEAAKFFRKAAQKYGNIPNVIFEIYNEPIRQNWSETIKPYHERIVSVIREHSSNLIVLGTKTWSQDVDEAAEDPVQGENLAYTIHFYANTHMQELLPFAGCNCVLGFELSAPPKQPL